MKLIVARLEWMSDYQGYEELQNAIGIYGQQGHELGESLNFFVRANGKCYGWWRIKEGTSGSSGRMRFPSWGVRDDKVSGVLVVFVAKRPESNSHVVVGFYKTPMFGRGCRKIQLISGLIERNARQRMRISSRKTAEFMNINIDQNRAGLPMELTVRQMTLSSWSMSEVDF